MRQPLFIPELLLKTGAVKRGHGRWGVGPWCVRFVCLFFMTGTMGDCCSWKGPTAERGYFSRRVLVKVRGVGPESGGRVGLRRKEGAQHREKQGAGIRANLEGGDEGTPG